VATSRLDDGDAEWTARIAEHRARRPPVWRTIETAASGTDLPLVVASAARDQVLIVESVGTWLGAQIGAPPDGSELDGVALETRLVDRARTLVSAFERSHAEIIAVCEQTGWGLVPPYVAGRVFSSVLGRLTTTLARRAAASYLAVAGYALDLRTAGALIDTEENL